MFCRNTLSDCVEPSYANTRVQQKPTHLHIVEVKRVPLLCRPHFCLRALMWLMHIDDPPKKPATLARAPAQFPHPLFEKKEEVGHYFVPFIFAGLIRD